MGRVAAGPRGASAGPWGWRPHGHDVQQLLVCTALCGAAADTRPPTTALRLCAAVCSCCCRVLTAIKERYNAAKTGHDLLKRKSDAIKVNLNNILKKILVVRG